MNCNINVADHCVYTKKTNNFHSFDDGYGCKYGLGFHNSESGLKQSEKLRYLLIETMLPSLTIYTINIKCV